MKASISSILSLRLVIRKVMPRFYLLLGDTLAKLTDGEKGNLDLFLTLGTIRFSINEVTRFSPYFLMFGRLPMDNLVKLRRKYVGEDFYQIILQDQQKIFMQAKQRIKCVQRKRNERINKNRKVVVLKIGDPFYHKVHLRQGKLNKRWDPYYSVTDQTGPVNFIIWNQISGKVKRAHVNDLKLVGLEEWEISKIKETNRRLRRTRLVELPSETDSKPEIDNENFPYIRTSVETQDTRNPSKYDCDTEDEMPLVELWRIDRGKRNTSRRTTLKYRLITYQSKKGDHTEVGQSRDNTNDNLRGPSKVPVYLGN